jgi:hypothetical protein
MADRASEMGLEDEQLATLWTEDSAVAEIIAGELIMQQNSSIARDPRLLLERATTRAAEASRLAHAGNLDDAGHAMIGCALALALAARAGTPRVTPIEHYAADLAASVAWEAQEPDAEQLASLADSIEELAKDDEPEVTREVMNLAVRAGAHAAGLSIHISRRRQRRDLVEP